MESKIASKIADLRNKIGPMYTYFSLLNQLDKMREEDIKN